MKAPGCDEPKGMGCQALRMGRFTLLEAPGCQV